MWKVFTVSTCSSGQLQKVRSTAFRLLAFNSPLVTTSSRGLSLSRWRLTSTESSSPLKGYSRPKRRSNKLEGSGIPAGGWFLLIIPVSTLALGVWQVYRWRWKLGLIEQMRLKSIADPVPLPQDFAEVERLEYQKVQVRGQFDYTNEVLIGPRSLVVWEDRSVEQGRGVFSSGSPTHGFLVVTPFKVDGSNETILVNRGWIGTRNHKKFKHVEGPVDLVGIVRKHEPRAPFMTKSKPGNTLYHHRDVISMAEVLGTQEVFLDLFSIDGVDFSKARSDSIPVPRQTRITLRNEHVSYFVTWFSLSAITTLMWHRRFIKRLNLL